MPPPSSQRANIDPPPQVMTEAIKGFLTGALRYGSLSILAHLILSLPHPMAFTSTPTTPAHRPSPSSPSAHPSPSSAQTPKTPKQSPLRRPLSSLIYRPLTSFSQSLAPSSKVYRGLTPQFKIFLQIAAVTLGGYIWAEHRVNEYMEAVRRVKRAERRREEYGDRYAERIG